MTLFVAIHENLIILESYKAMLQQSCCCGLIYPTFYCKPNLKEASLLTNNGILTFDVYRTAPHLPQSQLSFRFLAFFPLGCFSGEDPLIYGPT